MTEHAESDSPGRPVPPSGPAGPEPPQQAPERDGAPTAPSPAVAAPDTAADSASAEPAGPTIAEFEDRWRRVAADLDNLRKRYAREVARARAEERERVAAAFLPVLDNIDRALQHAGADPQAIIEGIRAVRDQALAVLAGLGYPRDDAAGVPFDPARHEVVGVVEPHGADLAPGSVAEVLRPGYGGAGRQLRPAAVTVARAPED
jgi:molecular chaperone GrpE